MINLEELEELKSKNKFPRENWFERGLNPSPQDVILGMNREVNKFIQFIEGIIVNSENKELITLVQSYFDDMDLIYFDTEEREFVIDKMFEVLDLVEIEQTNLLFR